MDILIKDNRPRWRPSWRRLRRIQVEVAILAVVLAMAVEAFRLGPTRDALIRHHDEAARELELLARCLEGSRADILSNCPCPPPYKDPSAKDLKRARAYRGLALWYRWQAWRYRLPLFASVAKYQGLDPVAIDTREWIKKLGHLERLEGELRSQEGTPTP